MSYLGVNFFTNESSLSSLDIVERKWLFLVEYYMLNK
jgi:hypothetical protein